MLQIVPTLNWSIITGSEDDHRYNAHEISTNVALNVIITRAGN